MSPLLMRALKHPAPVDRTLLASAKAFECSAVAGLVKDTATLLAAAGQPDARRAFMPAEVCWLELRWTPGAMRSAVLLCAGGDEVATATLFFDTDVAPSWSLASFPLPMAGADAFGSLITVPPSLVMGTPAAPSALLTFQLYALLAIINSPRSIGRREVPPHKGLQRTLRAEGITSALRPWTEIVLEVPPQDRTAGDGEAVGGLTGRKAYHFVRKHARIRLGKLEFVSAHHRGDPALGVVQSSYRVKSGKPPGGADE